MKRPIENAFQSWLWRRFSFEKLNISLDKIKRLMKAFSIGVFIRQNQKHSKKRNLLWKRTVNLQ